MDELLSDFLTETAEHIEAVDAQLVMFEQSPSDLRIIGSIFRLAHTIKGTCGFLGLNRLAALTHAAETLIGRLRDGALPTHDNVTLILATIDRIRFILSGLETNGTEPSGHDQDLIVQLENHANAIILGKGLIEPPLYASPLPEQTAPVQARTSQRHLVSALDLDFLDTDMARASQPGSPMPPSGPVSPQRPLEDEILAALGQGPAKDAQDKQDDPSVDGEQVSAASGGAGRAPETIRVAVDTLERIMTLASELVLTRNQLIELTRGQDNEALKGPLQRLSSLTLDLQDGVMRARMQPLGRLFGNLPRLVRKLANDLNKKIELVTEGAETELDRQLIEIIRDPLTHIVRNCADHGIEMPETRKAAGKGETGTIFIRGSHEAGSIIIEIRDNGRGLDLENIKRKALSLNLVSEAELARMPNETLCQFIFAPGFSTAATITNISGRGIGMDVVRENIEAIGGSIAMSTIKGQGTTFALKIPLTLAIAPAFIVEAHDQRFALPQYSVVEVLGHENDDTHQITRLHGALVLKLRDQVLPMLDIREVLGFPGMSEVASAGRLVVVMKVGNLNFAAIVDAVSDVQEIVVKPLSAAVSSLTLYSGNTILGDGSVVLILDPVGLAATMGLGSSRSHTLDVKPDLFKLAVEASRFLLFHAGEGVRKALPLSVIAHIESFAADTIQMSDGMLMTLHKGLLMPIVPVSETFDRVKTPAVCVLVVSVGGEMMGLLIDEIVDIVEERVDIHIASDSPRLIGTAQVRGEAAEILDIAYYMKQARPNAFARGQNRRFRVLLVDDKQFFRDMLSPVLSASGYEVITGTCAAEGLAFLQKGAVFDVIVTDTDMPDMDGYSFAKAVRNHDSARSVPVIGLASYASPAVLEAAKASGMSSVIGKFDRAALMAALEQVLETKSLNSQGLETRIMQGEAA